MLKQCFIEVFGKIGRWLNEIFEHYDHNPDIAFFLCNRV